MRIAWKHCESERRLAVRIHRFALEECGCLTRELGNKFSCEPRELKYLGQEARGKIPTRGSRVPRRMVCLPIFGWYFHPFFSSNYFAWQHHDQERLDYFCWITLHSFLLVFSREWKFYLVISLIFHMYRGRLSNFARYVSRSILLVFLSNTSLLSLDNTATEKDWILFIVFRFTKFSGMVIYSLRTQPPLTASGRCMISNKVSRTSFFPDHT